MPSSSTKMLRLWQLLLLIGLLAFWHVATSPTLLPPIYFDDANKAAFFFGEPLKVFERTWDWFASGTIYAHLWVTLLDPYIKALNSMPRVILAPIFAVWFGLDIASKVALGVTLVFFIVFFNVYQGVREVSYTVLANARILGASERQLLRHVYVPSAMSWVFASLHNSVGLAFVGAVVGEYLGSSRGVGYLILQAEGTFDINSVFAGIMVLTAFALLLDWAVGLAEKRLMVWQPRSVETERA